MAVLFGIFVMFVSILLRQFELASFALLFVLMRICFEFMRYRNRKDIEIADANATRQLSNRQMVTRAEEKERNINLGDLMRKVKE